MTSYQKRAPPLLRFTLASTASAYYDVGKMRCTRGRTGGRCRVLSFGASRRFRRRTPKVLRADSTDPYTNSRAYQEIREQHPFDAQVFHGWQTTGPGRNPGDADSSRVVAAYGAVIGETIMAIGFVPFLTYFMLTWKEHSHSATVRLFPEEHRPIAYRTIARISAMIRSFIVGNLTAGLLGAAVCTGVFGLLGIPYFYLLGIISGFASLIPSFGVFLALLPPLAGGIGILSKTDVLLLVLAVIGTHVVMMNVLYPKLIGQRVRLNPLAVVLSLLFWFWIWGAMGVILAIPIVGAAKIVCDYVDSLKGLGAWLGDK